MKKLIFSFFILHSSFFILHSTAQVTFQKTFGGTGWDIGYSTQQIAGGGYIIAGTSGSFGAGGVYLIRIDANGDTLWTKTYGGTGNDNCNSVKQTIDGGYIITGATTSFGAGSWDVYLIRIDTNGDTLWTKTYGGINEDFGKSVVQTTDNGYIITGYTSNFGAGLSDIYLIRTDTDGDTVWTKTFGGTDGDGSIIVQLVNSGGYIIVGTTKSFGVGNDDIYLIRINASGDALYSKTYGGANNDNGYSVLQTVDSGFAILGGTGSFVPGGVYLIRTDANGDTLWTRTYGDACGAIALAFDQTADGGYILGGYYCPLNAFTKDGYLLRLDNNGNVLWSKSYRFGSNIMNTFYDVKQTADGGFIAVGETGDLFTRDVYVVKTDADGNSGCGDSTVNTITGSTNTIVGSPATIVGSGAIVGNTATITGSTATVDSVLCIDTLTGIGERDKVLDENHILTNFPNPFSDYTTIEAFVPKEVRNAEIVVYNLLGIIVKRYPLEKGDNTIIVSAKDLTSGIYFYALIGDERMLDKSKIALMK